MVHVYTGDGKGKTTSALGLSLRAWGRDRRVSIIQFMKRGEVYGEVLALQRCPGIELHQYGSGDFIWEGKVREEDRQLAQEGLKHAQEATQSGDYDMVVLDEICMAVFFDVLPEQAVLDLIRDKHPKVELILTGRRATEGMMQAADYVTEMKMHKHPYEKGISGREGVEF